jgi:hypothetical protein
MGVAASEALFVRSQLIQGDALPLHTRHVVVAVAQRLPDYRTACRWRRAPSVDALRYANGSAHRLRALLTPLITGLGEPGCDFLEPPDVGDTADAACPFAVPMDAQIGEQPFPVEWAGIAARSRAEDPH